MKHKIVILLLIVFFSTSALAQNSVAVYVTSNDGISQKIKKVVGSEIVATITSTNEYVAVERTEDFLAQVSQERGNYEIDDATLYNLGRKFGASNVCVVDIIGFNDGYYMVGRLLDIKTSKVWKTARQTATFASLNEIIAVSQTLAKELFVKKIPVQFSSYVFGDNVDDHSFIKRIENRDNYTKVSLEYLSTDSKTKLGICDNTYIEDLSTHKKYKLTDVANIKIIAANNDDGRAIGKGVWEYYLFFERIPEETNNIMIVEPNGRIYNDIILKPLGDENLFVFEFDINSKYKKRYRELLKAMEELPAYDEEKPVKYDYDNYYSIAFGNGVSYGGGNILGITLTRRMGGVWGVEPQISVGLNADIYGKITYSVGINVLYRGLYLSSMYGVNDYKLYYPEITDNYGNVHNSAHGEMINYKGLSFLVGWKCYFELYDTKAYLDFAAGCKMHDKEKTSIGLNVVSSAWNIGFGVILH